MSNQQSSIDELIQEVVMLRLENEMLRSKIDVPAELFPYHLLLLEHSVVESKDNYNIVVDSCLCIGVFSSKESLNDAMLKAIKLTKDTTKDDYKIETHYLDCQMEDVCIVEGEQMMVTCSNCNNWCFCCRENSGGNPMCKNYMLDHLDQSNMNRILGKSPCASIDY
jgi:hypothetical protein